MSSLDCQRGPINNCLVALLRKAETGDLRKEVVVVGPRSGMLMSSNNGYVALVVHRIATSKTGQSLENAIANGSVTGTDIDNQVDESIIGIRCAPNDKGTSKESGELAIEIESGDGFEFTAAGAQCQLVRGKHIPSN